MPDDQQFTTKVEVISGDKFPRYVVNVPCMICKKVLGPDDKINKFGEIWVNSDDSIEIRWGIACETCNAKHKTLLSIMQNSNGKHPQ